MVAREQHLSIVGKRKEGLQNASRVCIKKKRLVRPDVDVGVKLNVNTKAFTKCSSATPVIATVPYDVAPPLASAFVHSTKAYDGINREALWEVLKLYGVHLHMGTEAVERVDGGALFHCQGMVDANALKYGLSMNAAKANHGGWTPMTLPTFKLPEKRLVTDSLNTCLRMMVDE
eukprot:364487-Chlamydomonas_euryale.AAC.17